MVVDYGKLLANCVFIAHRRPPAYCLPYPVYRTYRVRKGSPLYAAAAFITNVA